MQESVPPASLLRAKQASSSSVHRQSMAKPYARRPQTSYHPQSQRSSSSVAVPIPHSHLDLGAILDGNVVCGTAEQQDSGFGRECASTPVGGSTIPKRQIRSSKRASGPVQDIPAPRYRRSNDLPDPERNPLTSKLVRPFWTLWRDVNVDAHAFIATSQTDLEEEYRRVISLYRTLQDKKTELEFSWMEYPYPETIQQLMDLAGSIQRVTNSARYIAHYSEARGFRIDFKALFVHEPDSPNSSVFP
ncbi:hypothetical protein D9613_011605 [Agrocybe pediades]|uniref:Uncharacterized protein n=1 Tax=Agrocybe pediades TaxID=84607 RepID=A0A8H4QWR9_9AGAR|nr:hypothetical protein D9613_011605 [Agrocybe pediades]